ncbi:MAG: hypothetical protein STSR0008_06000 [Ignavibacterium sp.]
MIFNNQIEKLINKLLFIIIELIKTTLVKENQFSSDDKLIEEKNDYIFYDDFYSNSSIMQGTLKGFINYDKRNYNKFKRISNKNFYYGRWKLNRLLC